MLLFAPFLGTACHRSSGAMMLKRMIKPNRRVLAVLMSLTPAAFREKFSHFVTAESTR
jgi:hypothetical protein